MIKNNTEIPSGSFRSPDVDPPKGYEVESQPFNVASLSLFRDKFNPKADVIYYPCSARDVSPSVAFPDSRVIYVDYDENSVRYLKKNGYESYSSSAIDFDPGKVDILIMINPMISPDVPSSFVVENGFVFCNDYHGTASNLRGNDQYQLLGVIRKEKSGLILDSEKLDDYWNEMTTDEEFRDVRWGHHSATYNNALEVVEAVTGKTENILDEYKKIIAAVLKEELKVYVQTIQEKPEMAQFLHHPNQNPTLVFYHEGKQFFLDTRIPSKKEKEEGFFVFQKIKKSHPANNEIVQPIETASESQGVVIDEQTNNVMQIILNNLQPEIFDYYLDVSENLSKVDKYRNSFVGSFPNYDTFTSIPFPLGLLERRYSSIIIDTSLSDQIKDYLHKISEFESPSRAEYPFIISGSTTQNGDINLVNLSIIEDPTPRELASFTISSETVSTIDKITKDNENLNLNTIVFCHNHPKTRENELPNSLSLSLDQEIKDRYGIKYPGYNLSTADIEQFIFLRNNTFANFRTGARFLYGVFLPDSELVLLDVVNIDGEERIVRIN